MDAIFNSAPAQQRGSTTLDPNAFCKRVDLHAIRVPADKTVAYRTKLQNDLLAQRRVPSVTPDPDSTQHRLLLTNYLLQCDLRSLVTLGVR
jgi:hypothetical protein